ncbi:MAG: restriction endonuclease [Acidobacteriaceae bacterium]
MWEIRVQHEGLSAYRVVRGVTKEEAELKATLQIASWNERWSSRESALLTKHKKLQRTWDLETNKEIARTRTEELQYQMVTIETLLRAGIEQPPFRWDQLWSTTLFTLSLPSTPISPSKPAGPNAVVYAPVLTTFDRIFAGRRAKKEIQAADELRTARAQWQEECAAIDTAHLKAMSDYSSSAAEWEKAQAQHRTMQEEQHSQIEILRAQYQAGDPSAVEFFCSEVLNRSSYPENFPQGHGMRFNQESGVLVLDLELPNQTALPTIKEVKYVATRQQFQETPISDAWLKRTYDEVLYQIALRTLHELFIADEVAVLKSVVFNGWVHSIDRATGAQAHGCILSVQAGRDEFLQINLVQVEPKACFRRLKGVASSKLTELIPVRPIATINKEDHRFVEGYAVAESLDSRTNLAAMDWLDFENLIRELFEREFSKNGGEVKITQASRDGGVDAIAFDPDPLRGGKIIIQAKRYRNVVGVSAVRDLFGTVHNEGANKGILVTTSTCGPDAYEFAKGKPLT